MGLAEKTFKKGEIIIKEGDVGKTLFFINEGKNLSQYLSSPGAPRSGAAYTGLYTKSDRAMLSQQGKRQAVSAVSESGIIILRSKARNPSIVPKLCFPSGNLSAGY